MSVTSNIASIWLTTLYYNIYSILPVYSLLIRNFRLFERNPINGRIRLKILLGEGFQSVDFRWFTIETGSIILHLFENNEILLQFITVSLITISQFLVKKPGTLKLKIWRKKVSFSVIQTPGYSK